MSSEKLSQPSKEKKIIIENLIAQILATELPEFASNLAEEYTSAREAYSYLENATTRAFHATISLRTFDSFIEIESFDDDADISCTAVTVNVNNDIVACFATAHNLDEAFIIAHRVALQIALHTAA